LSGVSDLLNAALYEGMLSASVTGHESQKEPRPSDDYAIPAKPKPREGTSSTGSEGDQKQAETAEKQRLLDELLKECSEDILG
jgi:hypothetical protein